MDKFLFKSADDFRKFLLTDTSLDFLGSLEAVETLFGISFINSSGGISPDFVGKYLEAV